MRIRNFGLGALIPEGVPQDLQDDLVIIGGGALSQASLTAKLVARRIAIGSMSTVSAGAGGASSLVSSTFIGAAPVMAPLIPIGIGGGLIYTILEENRVARERRMNNPNRWVWFGGEFVHTGRTPATARTPVYTPSPLADLFLELHGYPPAFAIQSR